MRRASNINTSEFRLVELIASRGVEPTLYFLDKSVEDFKKSSSDIIDFVNPVNTVESHKVPLKKSRRGWKSSALVRTYGFWLCAAAKDDLNASIYKYRSRFSRRYLLRSGYLKRRKNSAFAYALNRTKNIKFSNRAEAIKLKDYRGWKRAVGIGYLISRLSKLRFRRFSIEFVVTNDFETIIAVSLPHAEEIEMRSAEPLQPRPPNCPHAPPVA